MLTTGVDVADGSGSSHDGVADTFKFTNAAETVEATAKTLTNGDTLNDRTAGDGDVLRLNLELAAGTNNIGAKNIGSGFSATNIEKLVINGSNANRTIFDNTINMLGLTDVQFSGDFLVDVKFEGSKKVIETLKTIDASDVTAGTVTVDASKSSQALTITGPKELAATITGGKGDDTISADVAEGTAISIDGEVGNDIITVSGGGKGANVVVKGGDGEDVIDAGNLDSDTTVSIDGGDGADVITVSGSGTVNAGAGDDVITVMAGTLTINADAGNDVIDSSNTGADDKVTINAGAGNDVIKLGDAKETILFTASTAASSVNTYVSDIGKDIITGFTAGNGADADVLKFDKASSAGGTKTFAFKSAVIVASSASSASGLNNGSAYIIAIADGSNTKLYAFTAGAASAAVSAIKDSGKEIVTLTGVNVDDLDNANFNVVTS